MYKSLLLSTTFFRCILVIIALFISSCSKNTDSSLTGVWVITVDNVSADGHPPIKPYVEYFDNGLTITFLTKLKARGDSYSYFLPRKNHFQYNMFSTEGNIIKAGGDIAELEFSADKHILKTQDGKILYKARRITSDELASYKKHRGYALSSGVSKQQSRVWPGRGKPENSEELELLKLLVELDATNNLYSVHKLTKHLINIGKIEPLKFFVKYGLNFNSTTETDDSEKWLGMAKLEVIKMSNIHMSNHLQFLAEHGADFNVPYALPIKYHNKNKDKVSTYLIYAIRGQYLKSVEFLLASGVDVNKTDYDGKSALYYANKLPTYSSDREKIILLLKKYGAK